MGFQAVGPHPKSIHFTEAKKQFIKGRPIVAFIDAMGRQLWEGLSDILQMMTFQACPDSFHQGDGTTQLQQTAAFLKDTHKQQPTSDYILYNQDLAGFFTSIDKSRFLSAYSLLAKWYREKNPLHSHIFHIDHTQKDPTHRVHRGKSRQKQQEAASTRSLGIYLAHIPQLITAVLLLNYFTVGTSLIEQIRGAPMGSPCSPALCNIVVAVEEQCWHHTYKQLFTNHKHFPHTRSTTQAIFFATRYVDNHVLLIPRQLTRLPPFTQLTDASFYKPPVQLETEPGNIFLGFDIDPSRSSLTYQCTLHNADILHPQSATSSQTLRSSFQARARMIQRVTTPGKQASQAVRAMRALYVAAGYTDRQL